MSGCLDSMNCNCPFDVTEKRNAIAAVVSGVLVSAGWWIIIDVAAVYPHQDDFKHAYYAIGVMSTLAMFLINAVSNSQVRGEAMTEGILGSKGARFFLLFGFLLGFGSLIAAAWVMFDHYVVPAKSNQWPGVALFLQNALIFFGSLVYKFGRTEDLWG